MSLSRKLGFYTVLTAALTALSWLWQGRLHAALAAEERLTEAAAALVGGLWQGLAAAVILFGAGLYLLRSRREEGKKSPDGAFFAVFGGAALALMLTMLILYGGTETASGNTAAINFMVVVWCLLPVPVLVRQTVLVAALRRENGRAAVAHRLPAAGGVDDRAGRDGADRPLRAGNGGGRRLFGGSLNNGEERDPWISSKRS